MKLRKILFSAILFILVGIAMVGCGNDEEAENENGGGHGHTHQSVIQAVSKIDAQNITADRIIKNKLDENLILTTYDTID